MDYASLEDAFGPRVTAQKPKPRRAPKEDLPTKDPPAPDPPLLESAPVAYNGPPPTTYDVLMPGGTVLGSTMPRLTVPGSTMPGSTVPLSYDGGYAYRQHSNRGLGYPRDHWQQADAYGGGRVAYLGTEGFADRVEDDWKQIVVFGLVGVFILFTMDMASRLKRR